MIRVVATDAANHLHFSMQVLRKLFSITFYLNISTPRAVSTDAKVSQNDNVRLSLPGTFD